MYNIELTVLNTEKLFNAARFGNLRQKKFDGLAWPRLWPGLDCGLDWSDLVSTLVWSGRAVCMVIHINIQLCLEEEKIRHSFEQLPGNGGCCWQKRGRDFLSGGQVTRVYRREQGNSGIRRRSRVYFDIWYLYLYLYFLYLCICIFMSAMQL